MQVALPCCLDREWPGCPGIWVGTSRVWKNFMQENFGLIFRTLNPQEKYLQIVFNIPIRTVTLKESKPPKTTKELIDLLLDLLAGVVPHYPPLPHYPPYTPTLSNKKIKYSPERGDFFLGVWSIIESYPTTHQGVTPASTSCAT